LSELREMARRSSTAWIRSWWERVSSEVFGSVRQSWHHGCGLGMVGISDVLECAGIWWVSTRD
jgi:hypothetical protein